MKYHRAWGLGRKAPKATQMPDHMEGGMITEYVVTP
jgi:hypothetical protein